MQHQWKRNQEAENPEKIPEQAMHDGGFTRNEQHHNRAEKRREQDHAKQMMREKLHASRLSVQATHKRLHVAAVVPKQDRQANQYENRVRGKNTRLEHAYGHAEKLWHPAEQINQSVDNPFVPPHGHSRKDACEPTRAIYAKTVDDSRVE